MRFENRYLLIAFHPKIWRVKHFSFGRNTLLYKLKINICLLGFQFRLLINKKLKVYELDKSIKQSI